MTARAAIVTRAIVVFLTLVQVLICAAKLTFLHSGPGSVAFGFLMLLITTAATWFTFNQTRRWFR